MRKIKTTLNNFKLYMNYKCILNCTCQMLHLGTFPQPDFIYAMKSYYFIMILESQSMSTIAAQT